MAPRIGLESSEVQSSRGSFRATDLQVEGSTDTAKIVDVQETSSNNHEPAAQGRRGLLKKIRIAAGRTKNAVITGVVVALLAGSFGPAWAKTIIHEGAPLGPVSVRKAQVAALGSHGRTFKEPRQAHDYSTHRSRAALLDPSIRHIQSMGRFWVEAGNAMKDVEGLPDLTNMIPATPVAGQLMWSPQITGDWGRKIEVLPLLFEQFANPDGSLNKASVERAFALSLNPAPSKSAQNITWLENSGTKNGRAQYITVDMIGIEPQQPQTPSGMPLLPQLVIEHDGHRTVVSIGSLCIKGGGPSFKPSDRSVPLGGLGNDPIYANSTNRGMYSYSPSADVNENGWKVLNRGAYIGVTLAHLKLDELNAYELDQNGQTVGQPKKMSVAKLKQEGRISSSITPSAQWRGFETTYRLSGLENDEAVEVLNHVRKLFARDAIFDHMANNSGQWDAWQAAAERVRNGGTDRALVQLWQKAIDSLNRKIANGDHYMKDRIVVDGHDVASVSVKDYVRTAIHRSARNVVVMNAMGFEHNSIWAGGDNINAAWQMVDLDDLDPGYSPKDDPKDHANVSTFTSNLDRMITHLQNRGVTEVSVFSGETRKLLEEAVDHEQTQYGDDPVSSTSWTWDDDV